MSQWEPVGQLIRNLETVEGLKHLSFYAHKPENRSVSINGRSALLPALTEAEAESLAEELNAAIQPVLQRHADALLSKTANQLRRYL